MRQFIYLRGLCCSLWSLDRRWRWPMTKSLWTRSVMKKIQTFMHETSPLLPNLSLHIQPVLDSLICQSAVSLSVRIHCVLGKCHMYTESHKVKSRESKVCSILLITQCTTEFVFLQLLTACHSRAGPRQFGALGEIRIWGPQTATASLKLLSCLLSYLASEMYAPHSQKKYVLGRASRNLDGASRFEKYLPLQGK